MLLLWFGRVSGAVGDECCAGCGGVFLGMRGLLGTWVLWVLWVGLSYREVVGGVVVGVLLSAEQEENACEDESDHCEASNDTSDYGANGG